MRDAESENGNAFPKGSLKGPKSLLSVTYSGSIRFLKVQAPKSVCAPGESHHLVKREGFRMTELDLNLSSAIDFKSVSQLSYLRNGAELGFFPRFLRINDLFCMV